jgi:hypothetical protein
MLDTCERRGKGVLAHKSLRFQHNFEKIFTRLVGILQSKAVGWRSPVLNKNSCP